jgi:hypothetical protein
MNKHTLYLSSNLQYIAIYLCFLFLEDINIYVYLYYIGGTLTSILNHGNNSLLYQQIDRIYMKIGLFIDVIYIPYTFHYYNHVIFTLLACSLYIYSKIYRVIYTHVLAHFVITLSHALVLNNI